MTRPAASAGQAAAAAAAAAVHYSELDSASVEAALDRAAYVDYAVN